MLNGRIAPDFRGSAKDDHHCATPFSSKRAVVGTSTGGCAVPPAPALRPKTKASTRTKGNTKAQAKANTRAATKTKTKLKALA